MTFVLRGLPEGLAGIDRCLVMGILNVTTDSFSDGGRYYQPAVAIEHGLSMRAAGADLVDVGGESTRPGAQRVDEDQELERVIPVVRQLVREAVIVSVDTMRASVAAAALDSGAHVINDVSAGAADPNMARVLAGHSVPLVAMHWRGHSASMHQQACYTDVVGQVVDELSAVVRRLEDAGVDRRRVIVDPGLGFAKNSDHNWALLAHLDALQAVGRPLVIGASRKKFLAPLDEHRHTCAPCERDSATAALSALVAAAGVWAVRVHQVASSADAVRVAQALRWARNTSTSTPACHNGDH